MPDKPPSPRIACHAPIVCHLLAEPVCERWMERLSFKAWAPDLVTRDSKDCAARRGKGGGGGI
jgi:hypothetical protein